VETLRKAKEVYDLIDFIKSKKKKVGIAINPKTQVKKISQFLDFVDLVLVMTVNPGNYGSKFLPKMLNKIKEIRKLNKNIEIEVDGGMNDKTIGKAAKAGANRFVVGSYLQKSENVNKAMKGLR
jgi:ribulose-phosphate 3-epimerase